MVRLPKVSKAEISAFFRSDRAVLLACMGIALLFWLLVKLSQDYRMEFTLDIAYSIPGEKTFLIDPPRELKALSSGSGWDLMGNSFTSSNKILLEIKEVDEIMRGANWLKARARERLSGDLEILDINPEFIRIQLVDKKEKKVPVRLNYKLSFAAGFHQKSPPQLKPDSVLVTGPAPYIDTLQYWPTDSLMEKEVKNTLELLVELQKPELSVVFLSSPAVQTTIPVEELTEKVMFIPLTMNNAPDSVKIFPENVRISSVVGLADYNQVKGEDFRAEVDLADVQLPSSNNTLPITLTQKSDLALSVNFYPKSAEFYIVKKSPADTLSAETPPPN
jgi:YbbR domain-containing protein